MFINFAFPQVLGTPQEELVRQAGRMAGEREIGTLLPTKQSQHRTLHIQKDVLPYALCWQVTHVIPCYIQNIAVLWACNIFEAWQGSRHTKWFPFVFVPPPPSL
jgi:hypothetical protein